MSPSIVIQPISAEQTRHLRQSILRSDQPMTDLSYPLDGALDSLHVGAFDGEVLVGVASIFQETPSGEVVAGSWRLRGMAVVEDRRRAGIGGRLLNACLSHIQKHHGKVFWCNARTSVIPYYLSQGFQLKGEEFDLPGIGLHNRMWRRISGKPDIGTANP